MYTTVEGKGEKHRSHVLASGTGDISWQVMAGPAAGMARALGSHRGCRVSVLGSKPACSSQSGVEKTAEAPNQAGVVPCSQLLTCSNVHWAASHWSASELPSNFEFCLGAGCTQQGSGLGFPVYTSMFMSADRLCAGGIWQCCQGWRRVVAVDTHLVPSQVTQSEKIKGCKCSCSVSAKADLGVIYLFIDQSSIVLNSLSFWSVLGESTYITTFSHITAVIALTALKTAPHLAVLFRRTCRLVLGEDLAETPEYQALANKQCQKPAAARLFCRQPVGKSVALE